LDEVRKRETAWEDGFKIVLADLGMPFRIGSLQLDTARESPQAIGERKARARYLINILLAAPFLGANEVPNSLMYYL
jgi:hypothetical protein